MDARFRRDVRRWVAEVGFVYLLVVALIGLLFLLQNLHPSWSSGPGGSTKTASEKMLRYHHRASQE